MSAAFTARPGLAHLAPRAVGAVLADVEAHREGRFVFELARRDDDAAVRTFLRETAMPGRIRLTFEREPDADLAATVEGDVHQTIVARDLETGRLAGVAARSVRTRFVNGEPLRIGYLGQLRVSPGCRGLRTLLRGGFSVCHALHRRDAAAFYLMSLVSDNTSALRLLLNRGAGAEPRLTPAGALTTFALTARAVRRPAGRDIRVRTATPDLMEQVASCLQRNLRRYQFAPVWQPGDLGSERTRGLSPSDFVVAIERTAVVACGALWDQRAFKQVVVRGYPAALSATRPLVNAIGPLFGVPHLPRVGQPLRTAYLSHLAADDDRADLLAAIVDAQLARAHSRGLDYLLTSAADGHPLHPLVQRRWRHRAYASTLYAACWPDGRSAVDAFDGRPIHPEVAVL